VTTDKDKAEVTKNFLTSVFTGNYSSHISRVPESQAATAGMKSLPS